MARIFFTRPTIYIEIADSTLTMATMLHTRRGYHLKDIYTKPLTKLEVCNGVIFNPSALFSIIMQQLQTMGFVPTKYKAIISLPDSRISTSNSMLQHCTALQAALCCAKTGLTILRVIPLSLNTSTASQDEKAKRLKNIPNLLAPFQPQTHSPRNLGIIGALLFIAGSGYYCFDQTIALNNNSHHLQLAIEQLKKSTETTHQPALKPQDIKKRIQTTQTTITTIQSFLAEHASYAPLLKTIAQHIPDQVILTTLEVGKRKPSKLERSGKSKKKQPASTSSKREKRLYSTLTLKGQSYDADKIIAFNQALGSLKQLRNIRLTQLKRVNFKKAISTEKKHLFRYAFTLQTSILFQH